MKQKTALLIAVILAVFVIGFAQNNDKIWKDYVLYNNKTKNLIHNFKILESGNLLERGRIFRYFKDYGLFESMLIDGSEAKIVYVTDPDGMINADITNKEIYIYPKRSEKVLYLFLMRTMAKALESGKTEITLNNVTLNLEKQKEYKETDRVYSIYKVTTNPRIAIGEIICLDDLLIVQVDLDIFIRNARSYGFEDIFLLPEHFQYDKIKMQYTTDEYDYPATDDFYEEDDIKQLLKNDEFDKIHRK